MPTPSPKPKRPPARKPRGATPRTAPSAEGVADQMKTAAGRMLDLGAGAIGAARGLRAATSAARAFGSGSPLQAARTLIDAFVAPERSPTSRGSARAGTALRKLREAAGLTVDEVGRALDLRDPALLDALEQGKLALSFELILRLAAVLGRNDPVGFVMKLTRTANPQLWQSIESIGVGRLLLQSAREREFANIYRADDAARALSDNDFAAVLAFTQAAFEMAMALHGRTAGPGR